MTADDVDCRILQDANYKIFRDVGVILHAIASSKIDWGDVTWREIEGRILQKSSELIRRGGNDGR